MDSYLKALLLFGERALVLSKIPLIFFLAIFLSLQVSAQVSKPSELEALAQTPAWLKLVHYKKGLFSHKSEIDGASFFLHRQGRKKYVAELIENIKSFSEAQAQNLNGTLFERVECRFPARFLFFKKNLKSAANWQMPTCPKWEYFRQAIQARSATLVFSAYYLNNPASAFGHTFVRLNKELQSSVERHELLDYGIGYAASPGETNPLNYALGTLFGLFRGDFTSIPYYFKVQEYNDYESRDIWEFDLTLTEDEIEMLVAHFWELANTEIHYQYLAKNCSSLLMTAIEAAAPRLNLVERLPYWVVPADTVRVLYTEPGLVQAHHHRPSKRTQFMHRYEKLTSTEKDVFKNVIEAKDIKQALPELKIKKQAVVLDALIDYYDFRFIKQLVKNDPAIHADKQQILIARSELPQQIEKFQVPEPKAEAPQIGHGSLRSGLGWLWSKQGEESILLQHRFALHALLDPQLGYPRDSEINFLEFNFKALISGEPQQDKESSVRLEEFYAFAVKSLAPYSYLLPNISWAVRIGAERAWDRTCNECLGAVVGAGGGYTFSLGKSEKTFLTALLVGDLTYSNEFAQADIKYRLGSEVFIRSIVSPKFQAMVGGSYLHVFEQNLKDTFRFSEELRWGVKNNVALGFKFSLMPRDETEYRVLMHFYY